MVLVLDRIEEDVAVCENLETGEKYTFAAEMLPAGVREGDLMEYADCELTLDQDSTEKRREYINRLMDDVFN